MSNVRHYKKIYRRAGRKKRWSLGVLQAAIFVALLIPVAAFGGFIYFAKDLPRPERLSEATLAEPTKIYDRTGNVLLYEVYGEEKRSVLPLEKIPPHLQQAVIATEDAEFYSHGGISLKGIGRALLINLGIRESQFQRPGGSTITQQLARNSFLSREKTISRKAREVVLTFELERLYTKDEILGFYLNRIPFGSTAYGVGSASELYFQKRSEDITLEEAAALAALIQAPTYYSPYGPNKDILLGRKDYVLSRMAQEGFITPTEAEEAKVKELVFQDVALTIRAPHFVLGVVDELMREYGEEFVRENGLRITTTLDWKLQQAAEAAVLEFSERNRAVNAHNAALVALDPKTGEILALVGSKDWFGTSSPGGCTPGRNCLFDPKVNVATSRQGRQPGSAFKPFVYATAFLHGYPDDTIVVDEETNFGVWGDKEYVPQNYDGKFRGEVTLREALAQSLNIPSVKVLLEFAGIPESIAVAQEMGITTLLRGPSFYGPSLVLGGGEVRLLDIVSAYGVFAAEGKKASPFSILRVQDPSGRILKEQRQTPITVLSPNVARLVTNILADDEARAPMFGLLPPLYFADADVAVKTGTTNESRDAWTIGYTSSIAAGVWVGNSDNTPIGNPGVMVAAPMWRMFMDEAIAAFPKQNFTPPVPLAPRLPEEPSLSQEFQGQGVSSIESIP